MQPPQELQQRQQQQLDDHIGERLQRVEGLSARFADQLQQLQQILEVQGSGSVSGGAAVASTPSASPAASQVQSARCCARRCISAVCEQGRLCRRLGLWLVCFHVG